MSRIFLFVQNEISKLINYLFIYFFDNPFVEVAKVLMEDVFLMFCESFHPSHLKGLFFFF
jgi:hypothetical protein